MKTYIGDGIYAEWAENMGMLKLTTSDGISETNTIYFEIFQLQNLLEFLKSKGVELE